MSRVWLVAMLVAMAVALGACGGGGGVDDDGDNGGDPGGGGTPPPAGDRQALLAAVNTWGYVIQDLWRDGAIDTLDASDCEMLVVEPTRSIEGDEEFDAAGMVQRLRDMPDGSRRLVMAYVDIGEAEDYRTYWLADWRAPTATRRGNPDFLITVDPDGWSGNYPVAYWDERWKQIVFGAEGSLLDMVLDDGFDGVYLDWVSAYEEDAVVTVADDEGLDAADEMIAFIDELRQAAHARDPGFLVIAQNAPELATGHPEYLQVIDAIAQEDVHFSGESDTGWNDARSGDIRTPDGPGEWTRQWLYARLDTYLQAGLPVFTVDYCLKPDNAAEARQRSLARGYVPVVTRTPLDRLP